MKPSSGDDSIVDLPIDIEKEEQVEDEVEKSEDVPIVNVKDKIKK